MIITVTMNPAIDKTVEVDKFQPYVLNRIRRIEYDAGGKGINVSKTIHPLGGESLAMGFLGGNTGKTIENVLNDRNIRHDFIYVDGDTRTNTKIFDCVGGVTELNEPGHLPDSLHTGGGSQRCLKPHLPQASQHIWHLRVQNIPVTHVVKETVNFFQLPVEFQIVKGLSCHPVHQFPVPGAVHSNGRV